MVASLFDLGREQFAVLWHHTFTLFIGWYWSVLGGTGSISEMSILQDGGKFV